jgi:hypothetical protein
MAINLLLSMARSAKLGANEAASTLVVEAAERRPVSKIEVARATCRALHIGRRRPRRSPSARSGGQHRSLLHPVSIGVGFGLLPSTTNYHRKQPTHRNRVDGQAAR